MKKLILSTITMSIMAVGCAKTDDSQTHPPTPPPLVSPLAISVEGKTTISNVVICSRDSDGSIVSEENLPDGSTINFFDITDPDNETIFKSIQYNNNKATLDLSNEKTDKAMAITEYFKEIVNHLKISNPSTKILILKATAYHLEDEEVWVTISDETKNTPQHFIDAITYSSEDCKISGSQITGPNETTYTFNMQLRKGWNNIGITKDLNKKVSMFSSNNIPLSGVRWMSIR